MSTKKTQEILNKRTAYNLREIDGVKKMQELGLSSTELDKTVENMFRIHGQRNPNRKNV